MRKPLIVAAALALLVSLAAQGRLGVGGSFMGGSPIFDAFAEVSLTPNLALRTTFSYIASFGGVTAFEVDLSFLILLGMEQLIPYFGAGAGAMVLMGGGGAIGAFTINALAGVYWPLGENFGVYVQGRFLGSVTGGMFSGSVGPGVGLFVSF
ncbi:MAG: hypothetical protein GXO72_03605 [Caldiserica bacterium]|nr:hypothetical protein [Caldisericota bacterium]